MWKWSSCLVKRCVSPTRSFLGSQVRTRRVQCYGFMDARRRGHLISMPEIVAIIHLDVNLKFYKNECFVWWGLLWVVKYTWGDCGVYKFSESRKGTVRGPAGSISHGQDWHKLEWCMGGARSRNCPRGRIPTGSNIGLACWRGSDMLSYWRQVSPRVVAGCDFLNPNQTELSERMYRDVSHQTMIPSRTIRFGMMCGTYRRW